MVGVEIGWMVYCIIALVGYRGRQQRANSPVGVGINRLRVCYPAECAGTSPYVQIADKSHPKVNKFNIDIININIAIDIIDVALYYADYSASIWFLLVTKD